MKSFNKVKKSYTLFFIGKVHSVICPALSFEDGSSSQGGMNGVLPLDRLQPLILIELDKQFKNNEWNLM